MKTFCIHTLGCKVNQYESEQIGSLLRARGLTETTADRAELRIIHTCSVTVQAASQSRQAVRRMLRLPVLDAHAPAPPAFSCLNHPPKEPPILGGVKPKVLVTGCWATSDASDTTALVGADAIIGHDRDVAAELDRLLTLWQGSAPQCDSYPADRHTSGPATPPRPTDKDDGWMMQAGTAADHRTPVNKPESDEKVNEEVARGAGTRSLPLLGEHQSGRQRAFLKVQDGCDAHCTYCIIPKLRPVVWSKPIDDAVEEARRLVTGGHAETVLTGIFLGAYGQSTALRRRQPQADQPPLATLVEALCTRVPELKRLRLSSLEPGDLTDELVRVLRSHRQVVPHFHLPLQSGSDALLRRMNRQYTRDDFLRMLDRVRCAFDRPALTTDIIVGFPGETNDEFARTLDVVNEARFIHIHAFGFSPRPGTAAARWTKQFVHGPVVNQRMDRLGELAAEYSFEYRKQFLGQTVEVVVERGEREGQRHGRCERYFDVSFHSDHVRAGDLIRVGVDRVLPEGTWGTAA